MYFNDIEEGDTGAGTPKISRRRFFARSAGVLAATGTFGFVHAVPQRSAYRPLTVIAYNVYKCNGWPKDNKRAVKARNTGQMPARLAQELALYDPDIINFSESPEEDVVREIAGELKMNYAFFPSAGNWPGALLTRYKIGQSANVPIQGERPDDLFTRHWGIATVRLPDGFAVTVHSAHLFPHDTPGARIIREKEISEILKTAKADVATGQSVIIMGDLNHTALMPEYKMWMDAGWVDTFTRAGTGDGLTIRSDKPARRIDYVLAKGPVAARILESRPLFEGNFRTNPDDPHPFALSDHLPQMAIFAIP